MQSSHPVCVEQQTSLMACVIKQHEQSSHPVKPLNTGKSNIILCAKASLLAYQAHLPECSAREAVLLLLPVYPSGSSCMGKLKPHSSNFGRSCGCQVLAETQKLCNKRTNAACIRSSFNALSPALCPSNGLQEDVSCAMAIQLN